MHVVASFVLGELEPTFFAQFHPSFTLEGSGPLGPAAVLGGFPNLGPSRPPPPRSLRSASPRWSAPSKARRLPTRLSSPHEIQLGAAHE